MSRLRFICVEVELGREANESDRGMTDLAPPSEASRPDSEERQMDAAANAAAKRQAIYEKQVFLVRKPVLDLPPTASTVIPHSFIPKSEDDALPTDVSFTELFPDLAVFTEPSPPVEGRIDRRRDESTAWAGRLTHTTRLLDMKPILVSSLQPSKNMGLSARWEGLAEEAAMADEEAYQDGLEMDPASSEYVPG